MPVSSRKSELLAYIEPFYVGSGRQPDAGEMKQLQALIRNLAGENPTPTSKPRSATLQVCGNAFSRAAGSS